MSPTTTTSPGGPGVTAARGGRGLRRRRPGDVRGKPVGVAGPGYWSCTARPAAGAALTCSASTRRAACSSPGPRWPLPGQPGSCCGGRVRCSGGSPGAPLGPRRGRYRWSRPPRPSRSGLPGTTGKLLLLPARPPREGGSVTVVAACQLGWPSVTPAATWPRRPGPSRWRPAPGRARGPPGTVRQRYVFTGPAEARALASRADDCGRCGSGRRWPPSITP